MPLFHIAAIIYGVMALVSCASTQRPDVIIHESPEGSGVYLERMTDSNVQPAHPIKLDRELIARVLNGVEVGEPRTAAHTLFSSDSKPERVFSDEDTAFLTPLISSALSQATVDQQVRFRIVHFVSPIAHSPGGGAGIGSSSSQTGGLQKEVTAGTLYAHGLSLHFTLSEFRHRAVKPDVISGPNRYYPDPTGLKEREVQFTPQSALRADSYKQSDGNTLAIDYEALARSPQAARGTSTPAPVPTAMSTPASGPKETPARTDDRPSSLSEPAKSSKNSMRESDEVQPLKDLVIKKDLELEALKKELRSLRRQLSERDAQLDSMRKKTKPASKSPDTLP